MADITIDRSWAFPNSVQQALHKSGKISKTVANGATGADLVKSITMSLVPNALLYLFILKIENTTNVITVTVTIEDSDSNIIYTSSALSKGTTHQVYPTNKVPMVGDVTVKLTASGDPGASGCDLDFTAYIQ